MWIKQEIIRSKEIRMFRGVDSLGWETYARIMDDFIWHVTRHEVTACHPKLKKRTGNSIRVLVDERDSYHPKVKAGLENLQNLIP